MPVIIGGAPISSMMMVWVALEAEAICWRERGSPVMVQSRSAIEAVSKPNGGHRPLGCSEASLAISSNGSVYCGIASRPSYQSSPILTLVARCPSMTSVSMVEVPIVSLIAIDRSWASSSLATLQWISPLWPWFS